jgi:hypothetical protein
MIFEDTKDLLQKTEEVVLDLDKSKKRWINIVDRIINFKTIGLIFVGWHYSLVRRIVLITIIFGSLTTIIGIIKDGYSTGNLIANMSFALLFAVVFAPFILPSKAFDSDIKDKDIEEILKEIKEKSFSSSQLQAVKNALEMLRIEFESKMRMSKWVIAALWAIFLYLFVQYCVPAVTEGKSIKLSTVKFAFLGLSSISFFYFVERCYFRGVKKVFLILNLALNEALAEKE